MEIDRVKVAKFLGTLVDVVTEQDINTAELLLTLTKLAKEAMAELPTDLQLKIKTTFIVEVLSWN